MSVLDYLMAAGNGAIDYGNRVSQGIFGQPSALMQQIANQQAIDASTAPINRYDQAREDIRAQAPLAMAMGVDAAPGRGAALPMDEASRMARARKQGFLVDTPLYHGTQRVFDRFSRRKLGSNAGDPLGAFWFSDNPETASQFSMNMYSYIPESELHRYSPNVIPSTIRSRNPLDITDWQTSEFRTKADAINYARQHGHDAVIFRNMIDGSYPSTVYAVFEPNQVRSRFAAFDPAKRNSSDLLAGIAGGAVALPWLLDPRSFNAPAQQ